ncbi:MAG: histidine phosphatase family protein [Acidimicrobiia bacterium]
MDLLWVRHGEPERIAPGLGVPADPALTPLGREQAQRLAEWLAPEAIDAVVSSPLRRATETAAPIAAAHGLEVEIVDGLIEYDSKSDHYIPTEELAATKDERWLAMVEGRWESFGADPPEVFLARVSTTFDTLVERFAGQRVVAVCHGGVVNVALGLVLGIGGDRPLWFEPGYSSLHRVKASRHGIRSIGSVNELAHLQARRDSR